MSFASHYRTRAFYDRKRAMLDLDAPRAHKVAEYITEAFKSCRSCSTSYPVKPNTLSAIMSRCRCGGTLGQIFTLRTVVYR